MRSIPLRNPYSLGILIEWKQDTAWDRSHKLYGNPYSLGILIEWKLMKTILDVSKPGKSLLARDIN